MKSVDALPTGPGWWCIPHQVNGDSDKIEDLEIWMRDPVECIEELLGKPTFAEHLRFAPVKKFKRGPGGDEQVYDEMWTANWWCEMQLGISVPATPDILMILQEHLSQIDQDATIAPLILASDKTQLSVFSGDKTAWPIYLTLGNLPKHLRRKTSLHTTILIAYLPVSKLGDIFSNETAARHAWWQLFHDCMCIVFDRLISAGRDGVEMTCGDGYVRRVYPLLATYVADFPEQCLVTACSESRCPICETPSEGRGSFESASAPTREHVSSLPLMGQRKRTGFDSFDFIRLGLWPVWPFWSKLPFCSIFRCITPDALHQLHKGLFKDHIVKWATKTLGASELDRRYQAMPLQQGIQYFKHGLSRITHSTGHEHRQMEKVFLGALAGAKTQLVKCGRSLLDFIYLSHFTSLTETEVTTLGNNFRIFHENKDTFTQFTGLKDFDGVAKTHMPLHQADSIRALGTPNGYNTEGPERFHIDFGKDAWCASNHVNATKQTTIWLQRQDSTFLWDASFMLWNQQHGSEAPVHQSEDDLDKDNSQNIHPTAPVLLATRPAFSHKDFDFINNTFDVDTSAMISATNKFLNDANHRGTHPHPQLAHSDVLDLWTRARLIHTANLPRSLDSDITEVVQALPHQKDGKGRIKKRGILSTGLALWLPNTSTQGIGRYRVVRIRLIFKLPHRIRHQHPKHLTYVEVFSPFAHHAPRAGLGQYSITPLKKANGIRTTAVIHLERIKLSCHLTPQFNRMEDVDWDKTDDLIGTFSHFNFNNYATHIMYGYLHMWKELT